MKAFYALLMFTFVLSSCSVFKGSRRMDMSPFAENTRVLFAEAIKIERPFQFKELKDYRTIPEYQNLSEKAKPVLTAFKGIIFYSIQVVAINNSKLSERDKCRMLANYLDEAMEKALAEKRSDTLQVDISHARQILEDIRNAKTYLVALAAAEPIIHGVVAALLERINDIQNQIPSIASGFDREIEKKLAAARENYVRLLKLQDQLILSVTRLYNSRIGDEDELEKLLQENASLRYFIPSADKANYDNLTKAENFLLGQVKEIELMIKQLDDLKAAYLAKQDEMMAWRADLDGKIVIARTALTIWERSHKNLGAGIPVPPLINVSSIAGSLAGKTVSAIVP